MTAIAFAVALGGLALHLAVMVRAVLVGGREPQARAAWLLLLCALPGVGTVLYVLFGVPWVCRRFRRRVAAATEALRPFAAHEDDAGPTTPFDRVLATCAAASGWRAVGGNATSVPTTTDEAIDALFADIDRAEHSVHLSFYIWLGDHNGLRMAEAVAHAAGRGVACRIVADAIGSRAFIASDAWSRMSEAGARMCASMRVPFGIFFLAGHRFDFRNHRKIAVVDGTVTYCGSQNCADPAFLVKLCFGPWVDVFVRYEGPVARQADMIFSSLWTVETGEDMHPTLARDAGLPPSGGIPVASFATGPLSARWTMTDVFVACLAAARHSATVTTPYFVPDPPLLTALTAAARRGVSLTIMFLHCNERRMVGAMNRVPLSRSRRSGRAHLRVCWRSSACQDLRRRRSARPRGIGEHGSAEPRSQSREQHGLPFRRPSKSALGAQFRLYRADASSGRRCGDQVQGSVMRLSA